MDLRKRIVIISIICLLGQVLLLQNLAAQFVTISGTIYDISARRPLEAVGVYSSSGKGAITDSLGKYSITVLAKDSLWFSLIGKVTMKYPVDTITNPDNFNVMIHVRATELPEVKVRNSYYHLDSVQNRQDYAKIFNFRKPGLRLNSNPGYSPGGLGVGFDLDEIINMFRVKRSRSILGLQKRLVEQERDKYVSNRYSKQFVRKITRLTSPELDTFMNRYRPEYEVVQLLNDLELGYYVQISFEQYRAAKNRGYLRKREE